MEAAAAADGSSVPSETMEDAQEDEKSLVEVLQDLLALPFQVLWSPAFRRFSLRATLLTVTAFVLAGIAIAAYGFFYASYIPALGLALPIHLQFSPNDTHHPYGIARLTPGALATKQAYDVRVEICLPRTRENIDVGNFMIEVEVQGKAISPASTSTSHTENADDAAGNLVKTSDGRLAPVLAREARSAILPFQSPVVGMARTIAALPLVVLGLRSESECLKQVIMEGVEFKGGSQGAPHAVKVEVRSIGRMKVYRVGLIFAARFKGLRWLMYNYRILSLVVFTSMFWTVEMTVALLVWTAVSLAFSTPKSDPTTIKASSSQSTKQATSASEDMMVKPEDDVGTTTEGLSDTSRSFPTFSRQPPLRYSSNARVKREDEGEEPLLNQPTALEADDEDEEDEDADFVLEEPGVVAGMSTGRDRDDSGLGTSMESSGPGRSIRRRSKRESDDW